MKVVGYGKNNYFCTVMKTIIVIVSGLADVPESILEGKTPLMLADTPALDTLAHCGCAGVIQVCPEGVHPTRNNAILALLGYDFEKGIPTSEGLVLLENGRENELTDKAVRYFVIPKFSGHGVMISHHAEVRGIGKMALLTSCNPAEQHRDDSSGLQTMAHMAITAAADHELVVVHTESAAAMSRKRDPEGKRKAIELIDQVLIRPIADYVWNAREQMNMVVVSDTVFSWRRGIPVDNDVPAVVYFNDDLPYDTPRFDEVTLEDGPLNTPLPGDLIKFLISFEPIEDFE